MYLSWQMGWQLPGMVCFLLKCSLAELLSQVIPIVNEINDSFCYLIDLLLVLLYQLASFIQKLINAVGRSSTVGRNYLTTLWKHHTKQYKRRATSYNLFNWYIRKCISAVKNWRLDHVWKVKFLTSCELVSHHRFGMNLDFWTRPGKLYELIHC